jgi:hypothetical protein
MEVRGVKGALLAVSVLVAVAATRFADGPLVSARSELADGARDTPEPSVEVAAGEAE